MRRRSFAVAAFLLLMTGCSCPRWSSRVPDDAAGGRDRVAESSAGGDTSQPPAAAPAAIARNSTDAEIVVEGVELREGGGYVLKGTVANAAPAGGRPSMAEAGQTLSLTPWYPGGAPDLSNPAQRRLAELSGAPRGTKIRCRITLDGDGRWRIVSAE